MSEVEDKTLCALQEEGYIESNVEDFKRLIQPAHFFCNQEEKVGVPSASEPLCLKINL